MMILYLTCDLLWLKNKEKVGDARLSCKLAIMANNNVSLNAGAFSSALAVGLQQAGNNNQGSPSFQQSSQINNSPFTSSG